MTNAPPLVDSTQCHLWTDALHLRQLAREARNRWDRGTYVRMCVVTVWTTLEVTCQDALSTDRIGYRFKEDLDGALSRMGAQPIDWSRGLWQKVRSLQETRKTYVHSVLKLSSMFPGHQVSDEAIEVVRAAIADVYGRIAFHAPRWIELDDSRGWDTPSNFGTPNTTAYYKGTSPTDTDTCKVFLVVNGQEFLVSVFPAGLEVLHEVARLIETTTVPFNGVRVYDRGELTHDLRVNMRGSA
jgi:hypothetical protein